jgi:hypothetical protein
MRQGAQLFSQSDGTGESVARYKFSLRRKPWQLAVSPLYLVGRDKWILLGSGGGKAFKGDPGCGGGGAGETPCVSQRSIFWTMRSMAALNLLRLFPDAFLHLHELLTSYFWSEILSVMCIGGREVRRRRVKRSVNGVF